MTNCKSTQHCLVASPILKWFYNVYTRLAITKYLHSLGFLQVGALTPMHQTRKTPHRGMCESEWKWEEEWRLPEGRLYENPKD